MANDATDPDGEVGSRLVGHLIEPRSRLLRASGGLLLLLLALLPFANRLYAWLAQPLLDKLPAGGRLIATEVASPFFAPRIRAETCCAQPRLRVRSEARASRSKTQTYVRSPFRWSVQPRSRRICLASSHRSAETNPRADSPCCVDFRSV